jgi:peptidase MA superfamily protein
MHRILGSIVLATVLLAGCAVQPAHRDAAEKLTRFQSLPEEPRVLYEPGARDYAERVAAALPTAVARVEATHYLPFASGVKVYVCGSDECFRGIVPDPPNLTAAVAYDNRLVLHPRLFDREPERLQPILRHELSHLHLGQRIGHYSPAVPVWFHEGLACHAAGGGGADLVTEDQARDAITAGRNFLPDATHDPGTRKYARYWNLDVSVFYREATMLVEQMEKSGEERFRAFLLAIQNGTNFDLAFSGAYGTGANAFARDYFEQLRGAPAVGVAGIPKAAPP